MIDKETGVFVPDFSMYSWNRVKFPAEELLKYPDEWVAFSPDGTRILAHGKVFEEVRAAMRAKGLNPSDAVWDQLPPAGEDTII
jgi:hypothetical protein